MEDKLKAKINIKSHVIRYKFLYTILILLVYLVGRSLPLYGIDLTAYLDRSPDVQDLLLQTVTGDLYRYSIFSLGIAPYMMAMLFVQMASALRSSDAREKTSPGRQNRISLWVMLLFAVGQAVFQAESLVFAENGQNIFLLRTIAVVEMVTGAVLILWLSDRNRQYGIGGQTTLIFVNMVDNIRSIIAGRDLQSLGLPVLISVIVLLVMVYMENTEVRIAVQRISIHNIYADKNYFAIKLNPIGIMPVMFSTAFFMIPQLLLTGLHFLLPDNQRIGKWMEELVLNRPAGIVLYLFILFGLSIFFSMVFIHPGDITEQFLKSGDSLLNIHAGKDTRRYLTREVLRISLFSAFAMSICLGVPLWMQYKGQIEDSGLAMLPSSVMMLTGIWCNLYREVQALRDYDSYRPFI